MSMPNSVYRVKCFGEFKERELVIYEGNRGRVVAIEEIWMAHHEGLVPIVLDGEETVRGVRPSDLKRPIVR